MVRSFDVFFIISLNNMLNKDLLSVIWHRTMLKWHVMRIQCMFPGWTSWCFRLYSDHIATNLCGLNHSLVSGKSDSHLSQILFSDTFHYMIYIWDEYLEFYTHPSLYPETLYKNTWVNYPWVLFVMVQCRSGNTWTKILIRRCLASSQKEV